MTKPLSPAAEAVMDAAFPAYEDEHLYTATCEQHVGMIAAAALRTAANQVIPDDPFAAPLWTERDEIRAALFAIADELKDVK